MLHINQQTFARSLLSFQWQLVNIALVILVDQDLALVILVDQDLTLDPHQVHCLRLKSGYQMLPIRLEPG